MTHVRNQDIARQFDRATEYDSASPVQKDVADLLAGFIAREVCLHPPATILEIGCGTGYLTEKLLKQYPETRFIISDIAPRMITRTKEKLGQRNLLNTKIQFHLMDGEVLQPPPPCGPVSLIVSSLCIQWFTDRPAALRRFTDLLEPGGMIYVTTLAHKTFHEWRESCEAASVSCGVPDYPPLASLNAAWPACGKGEWSLHTFLETVPSAHYFLRTLKTIGASLPRPGHTPLSLSALQKAMALFDKNHQSITYQVAFGLFRKNS